MTPEEKEDFISKLYTIQTDMEMNSDPYVGRAGNNRFNNIEEAVGNLATILLKILEAK